jgi:hypothetical protein
MKTKTHRWYRSIVVVFWRSQSYEALGVSTSGSQVRLHDVRIWLRFLQTVG